MKLSDRLAEVMHAMSWTHADLMRISRQSSSVVSQWLGKGSKEIQTIGKLEAAQALGQASGFSPLWIAKGLGPKRVGEGAPTPPASLAAAVDLLAEALDSMSDAQRAQVAARLQTLAQAPDSLRTRASLTEELLNATSAERRKPDAA